MKKVIYGLCVVLCVQGMAEAQKIEACGADIIVTQYDKSLGAEIIYKSLECVKKEDSLEAVSAFREPDNKLQQRLMIGFRSARDYTLVILKDGEVIGREQSGTPLSRPVYSTVTKNLYYSSTGAVSWWPPSYNGPVELPFECVLMTTSGSEHVLRFTVKPLKTKTSEL